MTRLQQQGNAVLNAMEEATIITVINLYDVGALNDKYKYRLLAKRRMTETEKTLNSRRNFIFRCLTDTNGLGMPESSATSWLDYFKI